MTLLVLGGTSEAKHLAVNLAGQGIALIYSLAGLVRTPDLDCEIISGGFSRHGGLPAFIKRRRITAILDATHPYAQGISINAARAGEECAIPCWRYQRPPWRPGPGDDWRQFSGWDTLLPALRDRQSVFLTAGQLDRRNLDALVTYQRAGQRQLLRTAVPPKLALPPKMQWIQGIGPFDRETERKVLIEHNIDALVSKNSGGPATAAKLSAAREQGIPVYMLARPTLPTVDRQFNDTTECERFIKQTR